MNAEQTTIKNREAFNAWRILIIEIGRRRDLVLVAEYLAQPRRQATILQRLGDAIALQRLDQPFGPAAVPLDVPVADERVVKVCLLGIFAIGHGGSFPHVRPAKINIWRLYQIFSTREGVVAGGLANSGIRQAAVYVAKILKSTPSGDLPIVVPTKIELVINLKTAKTLGRGEKPADLPVQTPTK